MRTPDGTWRGRRDLLDQAFLVGIVHNGVLGVVGGLLLLLLTPATIDRVVRAADAA